MKLAFASNGDGTLAVLHEDTADKFTTVETVTTEFGACAEREIGAATAAAFDSTRRTAGKMNSDASMRDILWISIGAVLGANLRYAVSHWASKALSPSLPLGTLIINVTGSFILGFFLVWTTERVLADPRWRALVAVGFCGAYTTFSSYAFETQNFWQQGHHLLAAGNFVANNLLALAGVMAGALLARTI